MVLSQIIISADHHPARIATLDKGFSKKIDLHFHSIFIQCWDIHKTLKIAIPSTLTFFVMKIRKNSQYTYQKSVKERIIYYQDEKKERDTMFLPNILVRSCVIIYYIVEENVFAVFVDKLLVQKKLTCLKLMTNKEL